MNVTVILLIFGMALVTYIPRALPGAVIGRLHFHPKVEKFLTLIPYTAMAALIFPGVVTVDASRPEIGLIGGAVAAVLAWRKCPVILCVAAAILMDMLLYVWF